MSHPLHDFLPATRAWFDAQFDAPTPVQVQGWAHISAGEHVLMLAPTGSGKTLAAFLWCIDRLFSQPSPDPGVQVLYISPLKALATDVRRNLREPLDGIRRLRGAESSEVRVASRTGDTPQSERRALLRDPAQILVTTPESLFLLLSSKARASLRTVRTVIIDEIHAVAGTKRGSHLALSLERLAALTDHEPQRIGLSATQRPLSRIARFLGGDRPVQVVDVSGPPHMDLRVVVPVPDLDRPPPPPSGPLGDGKGLDQAGVWPHIYPALLASIRAAHSTIVFTNSRRLCERIAQRLNELCVLDDQPAIARAHHGSISHADRADIEGALKLGTLRCIVATSSLELGIDMGAVDQVLLVESPGAVSSGLQRIGRAGHSVGARSLGRIYPKYRGDLLEAAAAARGMCAGRVERTHIPRNPLDVLAQQLVGMCVVGAWSRDELAAVVRRADPFRELSDGLLDSVLHMLSGGIRGRGGALDELRPRIEVRVDDGRYVARKGAAMVLYANAGTIADRGLYRVHMAPDGPRVGELDEEMVYESRPGDTFLLGASTWRVVEIQRDRVLVVPAPGESGRMPFWRGAGPGRPSELGEAVGALAREIGELPADGAVAWLSDVCCLDTLAARNLLAYLADQSASGSAVPTDRRIVVERFRDSMGDWRVCVLSPFGERVHAPWAIALRSALESRLGFEIQALWNDDGIMLRFPSGEDLPGDLELFPDPDAAHDRVIGWLQHAPRFAVAFREAAARALLLPRRRPGERIPLWVQRMRAAGLMGAARVLPDFPITLEAVRECLHDVFDMVRLSALLRDVQARRVSVTEAETRRPSPFARGLMFAFTGTWLYEPDAPLAERRAHALQLDPALLAELLGPVDLAQLLDSVSVGEVESALQWRIPERRARSPEAVHDLLRSLGDLGEDELADRVDGPVADWLSLLVERGRAVSVRVGRDRRWIAAEDAGWVHAAIGVGTPGAHGDVPDHPLEALALRFVRTRCFTDAAELADRWGIPAGAIQPALERLSEQGRVQRGPWTGAGPLWATPEVLRRIKRRALARLRAEISPVPSPAVAQLLSAWQGVGARSPLLHALDLLDGCVLPFRDLEAFILPCRVGPDVDGQLDRAGAMGDLVWVGEAALGATDARIRIFRPDTARVMLVPSAVAPEDPLQAALLAHLEDRGASFLERLTRAIVREQDVTEADVVDALWALVWQGRITNDSLRPLRGRGRRRSARGAGRWFAVSELWDERVTSTARALAWADLLLRRYGVVSRECALSEGVPGGFAALYPVLCGLEDAGRARRGFFAHDLGGAQFASPGAVDLLRRSGGGDAPLVLAACDPANPYGALLAWPQPAGMGAPLKRDAGALVVLRRGELTLVLSRGGRRLWTFGCDADALRPLLDALRLALEKAGRSAIRITHVDGALTTPVDARLASAGLVADGVGWRLEPRI